MQAIQFRNVQIPVVTQADGSQWVSVRHVCEALGINNKGQQEKLRSSPEFSCVDIHTLDHQGRNFSMFCIDARYAHLWIAGISSAKVSESIREQFIAYKLECADVIYRHFNNKGEDFLGLAQQLSGQMSQMLQTCNSMNERLDYLIGMDMTVFGDDAPTVKDLLNANAIKYGISHQEIWGIVRRECDVSSYKLQNRRVINFLRNLLGEGIRLVK